MKLLSRTLALALALAVLPALAPAQVLDLGDGGAFTNTISPSNAGRTVGAFWDNTSADENEAARACNIGFFAVGAFSAGCDNQSAGTFANQGGFAGGTYWGAGTDGTLPAAFMFSGAFSYNITLVGSVAGGMSEIGWFTRDAQGNYIFNPVIPFGTKQINTTINIGLGQDWGFYIKNDFNPATGGCKTDDYDCSDATGGYTAMPFQQFALFLNASLNEWGGKQYLVGVEDNALETMPNGNYFDSDYQDYILAVTVTPEPMTMALVATGLVGLAGAGLIRRRRERR